MPNFKLLFSLLLFSIFASSVALCQRTPKKFKEKRKEAIDYLIDQPDSLHFINEKIGKKERFYINPIEKEWAYLITNQFDSLLNTIYINESFLSLINIKRGSYHEDVPDAYRNVTPFLDDRFNRQLSRQIFNERNYILNAIENAELNQVDKDFLHYFLIYSIHQINICDENLQKESFRLGKRFLENHESSSHHKFIKKYSNSYKTWSSDGWEYFIKGSVFSFTGDLKNHLSNKLLAGVQLGYSSKSWYFSGEISFGRNRVEENFFHHIMLESNRRINTMYMDLRVGNHLLILENWLLTPYLGINLNLLTPQPFPMETAGSLNLRTFAGIGPRIGTSIDFTIPKEECNLRAFTELDSRRKSRVFRLDLSYNLPGFSRTVDELSGGYFHIGLGFGIFQPKVKEEVEM